MSIYGEIKKEPPLRGELVSVEDFLAEVASDFDEASCMVGGGHPAEYGIRKALIEQRKEYVLRRLRGLLKNQDSVCLSAAEDDWRRSDWERVNQDREEWHQ